MLFSFKNLQYFLRCRCSFFCFEIVLTICISNIFCQNILNENKNTWLYKLAYVYIFFTITFICIYLLTYSRWYTIILIQVVTEVTFFKFPIHTIFFKILIFFWDFFNFLHFLSLAHCFCKTKLSRRLSLNSPIHKQTSLFQVHGNKNCIFGIGWSWKIGYYH